MNIVLLKNNFLLYNEEMHELLSQLNILFQSWGTTGLAINAFVESFFLAPPPDILLITMDLAKPERALFYATICTLFSVLGGSFGYALGRFGGRPVFNFIFKNKQEQIGTVEKMYEKYGPYAVFFAAFSPVPFNVFTLASGLLNMKFLPFFTASIFGRGLRFFLVSTILMLFGEMVKQYINLIIIFGTILIIIFFAVLFSKKHLLNK